MRSFGDDRMSVFFGLLSWQFHAKVYVSVSSQIQYTKSEQLSCLVKAQVVHSTVLPRTRVVSGWHGVSAAGTGCQRLARGVSGWHGVSAAGTGCQRLFMQNQKCPQRTTADFGHFPTGGFYCCL